MNVCLSVSVCVCSHVVCSEMVCGTHLLDGGGEDYHICPHHGCPQLTPTWILASHLTSL